MTGFEELYRARTDGSRAAFERAEKVLPGGVCHTIRHFPPYPFFVTSAQGSRIRDLDGNEYVDFWMGHYALILGHGHPAVQAAVREQVADGVHWGIVNPWQVELAEAIQRMVPCAERVQFCNTGAEATMYAARTARGFTGRSRILKARGGWHGYNTDLLVAVHAPWDRPESLGLPASLSRDVGTFPFNDLEAATEAIRGEKDLAAVIVEPVLGAGGALPADPDFLRALREETEARDALLIFDEVITGFRLAPGGAQEHYGVVPDLVTLGKILGGGLPVGAFAGREEVMELINPRAREGPSVAVGGGTFSCNPLTMRAGLATLGHLEAHPALYERIGRLGRRVREGAADAFADAGLAATPTGIESLFQFHLLTKPEATLRTGDDVAAFADRDRAEAEFKIRLVNEGIYTMHGGGCLCEPHAEGDVDRLLEALRRVATAMAEDI